MRLLFPMSICYALLLPLGASAGKLTTLATFPAHNDGAAPSAALTVLGGVVYGVAGGGTGRGGTIFKLDPATGQVTTLYNFVGGNDGMGPSSTLTGLNGKLYGTTIGGGQNNRGTVFSFDPATGTETVLYSFPATVTLPNGALTPFGNLLYGTTTLGGAAGTGSVYSIDPSTGAQTIVYSFGNGPEGVEPTGGVVAYDGALYGLTRAVNDEETGALYRLDPATGQVAALYVFDTQDGPESSTAGLIVSGGVFYSTTEFGGANSAGIVFAFDPKSLKFSVVHTFSENPADGLAPLAGLFAANGLLYGTTDSGGASGLGTVFSINPASGAEVILHSFSGPDGYEPDAALIEVDGVLLSTASGGGLANDGTVFSVNPTSGQTVNLHSFTGSEDSQNSALISFQGMLYGTTTGGGTATLGSIYELDPRSGAQQTLYSFAGGADGFTPTAALVSAGGTLYGTTLDGGKYNSGTLFRFDRSTGTETVLASFGTASIGSLPSVLTNVSGILYGTTEAGGASHNGVLFEFDPASRTITSLHEFTYAEGEPTTGLTAVNGTLYGATSYGGTKNRGTVFSYTLSSGTLSTLYNFLGGSTGAFPYAGLVYENGALFGSTSGFRKDIATLYRIDPASGAETVVYAFPKREGLYAEMTAVGDALYGPISSGSSPYGNLFRFDPATQQFTTIYKFKGGADGGNPRSSLLSVGNKLYGTTPSITTANGGTVFRIHQ